MTGILTKIRSVVTLSLVLIYLGNLLLKSELLDTVIVLLMALLILLLFPVVTGSSRIIGYGAFGLSFFILIFFQAPVGVWMKALEENIHLVALFTLVPLLRIPIQHGGYFNSLQTVFQRYVNTPGRFYTLVSFTSAFIGILVNIAVVPLVHEISKASSFSSNKKLLSSAIIRGFATCTIWAPTTASIALIMHLTGAEWFDFFPFGLLNGIIAVLIGFCLTLSEERKNRSLKPLTDQEKTEFAGTVTGKQNRAVDPAHMRKIFELSGFGIILISSIAVISYWSGIQAINIVSLSALIFPILWLALIKRLPVWAREFKNDYFSMALPNIKNEIFLFVGAGLFAASINYSHWGSYVPQLLSALAGQNPLILTPLIIFLSLIFSGVGIHPIITITIIGSTVDPSLYGLSSAYLAVVLAICWALGISVSPSSANVIAIAGLTGQSPMKVGPRWNGLYVFLTALILILILTLFHALGLI